MRLKELVDEDFVNYKKPSMFIGTISCNGKCCTEAGIPMSVCQNDGWRNAPVIDLPNASICKRYINNDITSAIVLGGLEPFEQAAEVLILIDTLRNQFRCEDDVVIYTGFKEEEISVSLFLLKKYKNIIIKFGRYIPNQEPHYDEVLGVYLASDNQYAERIS